MDTDGKQTGYDLAMTRAIADAVKLPVIASGGAGTLEHLYQAIDQGRRCRAGRLHRSFRHL
jgi:cyclase